MKIGLIGDFQESVTAHRAIPKAVELAATQIAQTVAVTWLHTNQLHAVPLHEFSALWCVPASPYENTENVLQTINYARKQDIPFLGTCGGYQHAALEFARNELGYTNAENAEINPSTTMPIISNLSCKLYDEQARINLAEHSRIAQIYGTVSITEEYYCGFGVNSEYLHWFEGTDMYFSGFDEDGDPRSFEIATNKFFIGTAFQPERSALKGLSHPLVAEFLSAAQNA